MYIVKLDYDSTGYRRRIECNVSQDIEMSVNNHCLINHPVLFHAAATELMQSAIGVNLHIVSR